MTFVHTGWTHGKEIVAAQRAGLQTTGMGATLIDTNVPDYAVPQATPLW